MHQAVSNQANMTSTKDKRSLKTAQPKARLMSALPVVVATLLLLFFSVGEMFRHLLALMAVVGLYLLLMRRDRDRTADRWLLLFVTAFACLWIPIVLSVIDAESPRVAATTAARYLMYVFAGYLWIKALVRYGTSTALLAGAFAVLLFWTANALFQLFTGADFFGQEALGGQRLSGMMGPRLTLVLAIMSPVFFHALLRFGRGSRLLWLLVIPYLVTVLYGGSRVSWMLVLLSLAGYGTFMLAMRVRFDLRKAAAGIIVTTIIASIAVAQTDWLHERVTRLGDLFSGDYELVNAAVSDRLPHWDAAVRMYAENPINGIGVKNYKFSYFDYSGGDDIFRGQPHFFLLEVAAETGTIGLLGLALFLGLIMMLLIRLLRRHCYEAVPWGLALLLAVFPLSATLELYAHFMSALIWYLAMMFFGVAARESATR
jgi:O-antigen ligase